MKIPEALSVYLPRPSTAKLKMPPHMTDVQRPHNTNNAALTGTCAMPKPSVPLNTGRPTTVDGFDGFYDIKFSQDLKPLWVNIYDADSNVVVKIVFSVVNFNPAFESNHFDVEYNMDKAKSSMSTTTMADLSDLPLYPSAIDIIAFK